MNIFEIKPFQRQADWEECSIRENARFGRTLDSKEYSISEEHSNTRFSAYLSLSLPIAKPSMAPSVGPTETTRGDNWRIHERCWLSYSDTRSDAQMFTLRSTHELRFQAWVHRKVMLTELQRITVWSGKFSIINLARSRSSNLQSRGFDHAVTWWTRINRAYLLANLRKKLLPKSLQAFSRTFHTQDFERGTSRLPEELRERDFHTELSYRTSFRKNLSGNLPKTLFGKRVRKTRNGSSSSDHTHRTNKLGEVWSFKIY